MLPPHVGSGPFWRAVQRAGNWSLMAALGVSLILGAGLGQSSLATAQPANPGLDPAFFPATGYRISSPAVLSYFQHRGGLRTFGYPVSNEFPLLGKRVQLFQRQLLELDPDGTVTPFTILAPDVLPITHIDGLNLPPADPDLLAAAPSPDDPDYLSLAVSYLSVNVPDAWNGLPVNFQTTFLNSVSCADAFGADPCDQSLLPGLALELWGLPTSQPTSDPLNPDFVYQRFARGIMHYSRATGLSQGLLVGDWLKRVMLGVGLSPDTGAEARGSRFFAQYAPARPLALDRPTDLPDTSLAQAFRADSLATAGQVAPEPTSTNVSQTATNVVQTATALALTATAITATQVALTGSQSLLSATSVAATATANAALTPTLTPFAVSVSSVPIDGSGCLGDEQMWFVPRKPNLGVHVDISVTSQRHHDVRALKLAGPVDPGSVTERVGPLGFVWTWTILPTVEAFYQWTFFADGLRPCITSGFNAFEPLGATPTATSTPRATDTPGPTATPTPQPGPRVSGLQPTTGGCNDPINVLGSNFGTPSNGQQVPPGGRVLFGSRDATVVSWTTGDITVFPPVGATAGAYTIIVTNSGGSSPAPVKYTLTVAGGSATTTTSC